MAALEKRRKGDKPTREEAAALRRYEKQLEQQQAEKYYREIPKKLWHEWSKRQYKIILEQADRYDFPMLRGANIDLPAFVERFHDWLADIAPLLAATKKSGATSELIERLNIARAKREETKAKREELEYRKALGQWIELAKVREGLVLFASILRGASERIQREFGNEAHTILEEAIEEAVRGFHSHFGDDGDGAPRESSEGADDFARQ